jgi:L-threonylcarbamoyladenylate synthase
MIQDVLGISIGTQSLTTTSNQIKASGLLESHYAPKAKVLLSGVPTTGDGLIALASFVTPAGVIRLAQPATNEEYAQILYEAFRLADRKGIQRVFVIPPEGSGIAIAINDRLAKSANTKSDSI